MKKLFKIYLIVVIGVFSVKNAEAQTLDIKQNTNSDANLENVKRTKMAIGLPPIETIIDSVLKRSAMVNFRKNNVGAKKEVLSSERKYWAKNLGLQADTRYGNLSSFATSEDGLSNVSALTTAKQFNYSVGFFLKFPLFDAINRKNQIKLAKFEIDAAENMIEFEKEQIRKAVIEQYQNLFLKQKILEIRSKSLGDGKVNMQMVEKEFRNGIVPVAEYVRITSITASLEIAYEEAKSEFVLAKQLLEDLAGFKFDILTIN